MGRTYTYATKTDLQKLVAKMQKAGIICSEAMREVKKQFIVSALELSKGNRTRAAYLLGIHVNTLARNIRALGIDIDPHTANPVPPQRAPVSPDAIRSAAQLKASRRVHNKYSVHCSRNGHFL